MFVDGWCGRPFRNKCLFLTQTLELSSWPWELKVLPPQTWKSHPFILCQRLLVENTAIVCRNPQINTSVVCLKTELSLFHFVWHILICAWRPPLMELWVTYRPARELGQLKLVMRWTQWSRQSDFVMAGLEIWIIRVWSSARPQRWRRSDFSPCHCRTPANEFRLLLSVVLLRCFTLFLLVSINFHRIQSHGRGRALERKYRP